MGYLDDNATKCKKVEVENCNNNGIEVGSYEQIEVESECS
tara:strand:- start:635 stop:754 length:120 start_codon:yes stop_codon:yes gene_type:complete